FAAFTETFECRICRSLGDYEVALTPGGEAMGFSAVEKPKCEDCNNEDLVPWDLEAQGHCPRCGNKMRVDQSLGSINWD
ncbi:MAG TPA: hypothetical protein VGE15_03395, partial [Sphingobacteriaceae bacterium]